MTAHSPALALRLLAAAALAGACLGAQAQQQPPEQGRVVASEPITEQGRTAGYSVTYEYAGRTYTTRTDAPPGPTIPVQVSAYGVSTYPVAPQPEVAGDPMPGPQGAGPAQAMPEPGVVVSGAGVPYGAPPAAYPAPVYAAPVYAAPYAYPAPWVYPPVGLSLNLGYVRGGYHGWHRGWR